MTEAIRRYGTVSGSEPVEIRPRWQSLPPSIKRTIHGTRTVSEKQTNGIGKGTPGPGRKKGIPNRQTTAAKDAIVLAAQGLGGVDRLIQWAKEDPLNERSFWASIYPKLIPVQVTGENGGPIEHGVTLNIVGVPAIK